MLGRRQALELVSRTLRTFGLTDNDGLDELLVDDPSPSVTRVAQHLRSRGVLLPPSITVEFVADRLVAAIGHARPAPGAAIEVSCWDIDQFSPHQHVAVTGLALPILEDEERIKARFNALLDEWRLHGDWGGELDDLFSARCRVRGREMPAAFLLKGKSVQRPLRIKDCGKNSDQLLRLADAPANLFVVQHVHQIDQQVRRQLRVNIESLRARDVEAYCCFIDGTQTYQLLRNP